jgi:plasmid stabilization system protein ParE
MRLVWSPESRRNLLGIREFIGGQASLPRADSMIERIRTTARQLLTVPGAGRKIQPENRDDLRVTHARPFWIYYRIKADVIEIVTIVHYRQQQPERLSE